MTFSPAGSAAGTSRKRSAAARIPGQRAGSGSGRGRPAEHADPPLSDDWPHRSYLELGAFPTAVPCTRLHARSLLWEWGLTGVSDTAELIVSELVTNALRVSGVGTRPRPGQDQSRYIGLLVAASGLDVLVEVWDASHDPPVPQDSSPDASSGRGLLLVSGLTSRWGFYYPAEDQAPAELRDKQGKVVWGLIGSH
jgi:hypothetical protein